MSGMCVSTFQLNRRLVCVADRRLRSEGCVSGAACKVLISLEGALMGLDPTMFTCCILNLVRTESKVTGIVIVYKVSSFHIKPVKAV